MSKLCPKCKIEKQLEDFSKCKTRYDGLSRWCRSCKSAYRKTDEAKKRANDFNATLEGKERLKKSAAKNKERILFRKAKERAKDKNIDFNITLDDIVIPDKCPVLGIPIVRHMANGRQDNSPSLDRIDNTKGYVKGNVCVISWRANSIKSYGSYDEHIKIANYIKSKITSP